MPFGYYMLLVDRGLIVHIRRMADARDMSARIPGRCLDVFGKRPQEVPSKCDRRNCERHEKDAEDW